MRQRRRPLPQAFCRQILMFQLINRHHHLRLRVCYCQYRALPGVWFLWFLLVAGKRASSPPAATSPTVAFAWRSHVLHFVFRLIEFVAHSGPSVARVFSFLSSFFVVTGKTPKGKTWKDFKSWCCSLHLRDRSLGCIYICSRILLFRTGQSLQARLVRRHLLDSSLLIPNRKPASQVIMLSHFRCVFIHSIFCYRKEFFSIVWCRIG